MQDATLAPVPPTAVEGGDPAAAAARARLEEQIAWYDGKSRHDQRWFKRLKAAQLVPAAAASLAQRVEGLVSQQHAARASRRREAAKAASR